MGTFAYVPLQCAPGRSLRLVRLAPLPVVQNSGHDGEQGILGAPHGILQCQLVETSLDKAPPYIAVSHAWGDDTRDKATILVNGHGLNVSQALADLLAYLRKHCRPRNNLFWIDALCINHGDSVERGFQVPLMRQIYEKAWVLIAWLGTPGEDDDNEEESEEDDDNDDNHNDNEPDDTDSLKDVHSLHGFFQAFAKNKDRYGIAMKRKELRFPTRPYAHRTKEVLVYEIDSDGSRVNSMKGAPDDDLGRAVNEGPSVIEARLRYHIQNQRDYCQEWTWTRVSKLLSRPWFSRIWLVQEICCARNVQLAFGAHMLSWAVLSDVCRYVVKYGLGQNVCHLARGGDGVIQPPGFSHILAVNELCKARQNNEEMALAGMILSTSSFGTVDARDGLYSLLSLASPADRAALQVDYNMTFKELSTKLTSHLITSSARPAEILSLAGIGWNTSLLNLPSWVPNWSRLPANIRETKPQLFCHTKADTTSKRVSSYSDTRPQQAAFTVRPDLTTLRAEGYIIDKVQYLITTPAPDIDPSFALDPNDLEPWTDWMLDAVDMIRQGAATPYLTREDPNEVLWRTLITSRAPSGAPAGPEYGISFRRSIGRPFDSTFSDASPASPLSAAKQYARRAEETQRLLQVLTTHVESPSVSPGRAYIERMSHSSSQTCGELERLWKRAYDVHGKGKCLFTTKRGFVGLAAPGLAKGGEFYIAYLRDQIGYSDWSSVNGQAESRPLVLRREPCHEISTERTIGGRRNALGPGRRKSSSDSTSSSGGGGSNDDTSRGPEVPRFRLVSECYLHGGQILKNRARSAQTMDIY
ncbi:heterokaryon incompatibility protein-domain-containing protein [Microdochium bolleyi]|uniref:Heterokaryon incompatibility protein-domain-containing protein n=1 Tax=Microdochium bolleyi TaxID=196109 RepID=A0A136IR51_9PEZI|nr:heterokaryon incompatibility protein-domain-containing protein [Microdochium bolleyi]